MIIGIGLDLIETERIKASMNKPRFMDKVYTKKNRNICWSGMKMPNLRQGYLQQRRLCQGSGTGFYPIRWKEIEILRDDLGKPFVTSRGSFGKI